MVVCDLLGCIRGIEIGCALFIRAFVPIGDMVLPDVRKVDMIATMFSLPYAHHGLQCLLLLHDLCGRAVGRVVASH